MPDYTGTFQIPNLISLCGDTFQLRTNRHCRAAAKASLEWASAHREWDIHRIADIDAFLEMYEVPLLAALCFPSCDFPQLKTIIDVLTCSFCSVPPGPARDEYVYHRVKGIVMTLIGVGCGPTLNAKTARCGGNNLQIA